VFVGVARVVIQIPGARSLKERRRVVLSFKERLKSRLKVSAAEVGDADKYQVATVGVAVVSGDSRVCSELLDEVRSIAGNLPDGVLADFRSEVLSFGRGGRELSVDEQPPEQPPDLGDLPWGD